MTTSAVFTRDGKTAIVGDNGGFIIYWDVATGREVRRLHCPLGAIDALAITHDGKTLVSGGRGNGNKACVYLWDVETGKLFSQQVLEKTNQIQRLLITSDYKTLIVGDFGKIIRLWDVASKKITHELKGHADQLADMALSPDGKTLASCSWKDPNVRLWDIPRGKEKLHVKTHETDVIDVAYSPDGKTIVSFGNPACFVFFDADTGKSLRKVTDNYGGLQSMKFAQDGKTLLCAEFDGVRVRDAVSGQHLRRFAAPQRVLNRLTFSPDGKTLATCGGGPNTFDLWDIACGKLLHPAPGHRQRIASLVFSADGRQVFSSADIIEFPVQVWNARTGERLYELGDRAASRLAVSSNGKFLATSGYSGNFDGQMIGEVIGLWDLASREEALRCIGHKHDAHKRFIGYMPIDWSAVGNMLVSSSFNDKTIRLWDAATGKQRRVIEAKQEEPASVVLSPDGKIIDAGGYRNGAIRLWSAETGKEFRTITTPQQIVLTLAFSPDGSALASGGYSGAISLWEPATGRLLRQCDTKTGWTSELTITRDGRTLVSGHNDGSVHLWEIATGKELACFQGHPRAVRAVAISRDGRLIASGGEDGIILIWDATGDARPDVALTAGQLRGLWEDLNSSDAGQAYRALWQLALSPKQAFPFLAERLRPVAALDAAQRKQVDRWLADLDSDQFSVRQAAESELEKMGLMVEPVLRKALESKPSLEVRKRIDVVLTMLASERLRITRALEAIEHMKTAEARRLLEALSEGARNAWLTGEARAIRRRIAESSVTAPEQ